MKTKIKPTIAAALFLLAAWIAGIFAPAYSPIPVHAAEATLSAYDQSAIEDDLKDVDLTAYPKITSGTHRLISEAGFTEYAYSNDEEIAESFYGIYFYVYNPSEREISNRPDANTVNMAVSYNAAGEPIAYANVQLTLLSCTENRRFYKFKVTDSAALYKRAHDYAQLHEGERRYDIASLQLWYAGDRNATDEYFHDGTDTCSRTFFFTGFSKGCAADPTAESNLQIRVKELESLKLDVTHTFYRSQTSAQGGQNQLDTVYFSVSDDLFRKYGKLQRIKAEWYEFKTKKFLVTENPATAELFSKIAGHAIPHHFNLDGWEELREILTEEEYQVLNAYVVRMTLPNNLIRFPLVGDKVYYVFPTKDGTSVSAYDPYSDTVEGAGGITSNELLQYIYNYNATHENGYVNVGDKQISADLFEDDIDEARKADNDAGKIQCGYSYYDFDIDADLQEMISWKDGEHSAFVEWFRKLFGFYPTEESREFAPIYILQAEDLIGSDATIADKLMIQVSEVEKLKRRYRIAQTKGEQIVMFRFAVSNYISAFTATPYDSMTNAYYAQQSVFLDFDIIQLTFSQEGTLTAIPVAANPIDIVGAVTPPGKVDHEASAVFNWLGDFIPRIFTGQLKWWEWIIAVFLFIGVLIVIALIIQFAPLFIAVFKAIVWIVVLPFKLIAKAIKSTSERRKRKKQASEAAEEDDMT